MAEPPAPPLLLSLGRAERVEQAEAVPPAAEVKEGREEAVAPPATSRGGEGLTLTVTLPLCVSVGRAVAEAVSLPVGRAGEGEGRDVGEREVELVGLTGLLGDTSVEGDGEGERWEV